ncbi:MAG TPA: WhiB family transcriptional regulator [Candidatus Saccharimonas sp.]|nr:WhiB family transcriptional regulator [Candidatus Saccharimonas sp.]
MASDWPSLAACLGGDPDALFVEGAEQNKAKRICRPCPVRHECLADALDNRTEWGVWGGMTERERRAMLKRHPKVTSWRQVFEPAIQASQTQRQEAARHELAPAARLDLPSEPHDRRPAVIRVAEHVDPPKTAPPPPVPTAPANQAARTVRPISQSANPWTERRQRQAAQQPAAAQQPPIPAAQTRAESAPLAPVIPLRPVTPPAATGRANDAAHQRAISNAQYALEHAPSPTAKEFWQERLDVLRGSSADRQATQQSESHSAGPAA